MGTIYTYDYTGETATKIGGTSEQESRLHITAQADLEAVSNCELVLRVLFSVNLFWDEINRVSFIVKTSEVGTVGCGGCIVEDGGVRLGRVRVRARAAPAYLLLPRWTSRAPLPVCGRTRLGAQRQAGHRLVDAELDEGLGRLPSRVRSINSIGLHRGVETDYRLLPVLSFPPE